jgi:hypothetical protein
VGFNVSKLNDEFAILDNKRSNHPMLENVKELQKLTSLVSNLSGNDNRRKYNITKRKQKNQGN